MYIGKVKPGEFVAEQEEEENKEKEEEEEEEEEESEGENKNKINKSAAKQEKQIDDDGKEG